MTPDRPASRRRPAAPVAARAGAGGFRPFRPPDREIQDRLARTHRALRSAGFDGLLAFASFLAKDGHVCYLTNHKITNAPWSFNERNNGFGFAAVVLPVDGLPILLPGTRFDRRAVPPLVRDVRPGFDLARLLREALRDAGLERARLALAGTDVMPVYYGARLARECPHLRLDPADDLIEGLRIVKSPLEIRCLEAAARISDAGIEAAWRASQPGATEVDIANAAYLASMRAGADRVDRVRVRAGREMVAWGRWPLSTANRVRAGDLVYIDFVGWYRNYVWDEARCWAVPRPTAWQRALLEEGALLTDRMRETARPGLPVGEWVGETIDHFRARPFGPALSIVGHGVGLEVVENPWFEREVTMPLAPGMVLCLESGFVLPGKAFVRIEREIVIEEGGARFLGRLRSRLW
ncbi:MAG TPA: Xaa-Pro peptidase family protein [Methylomirabilota bacterium]|nr:Xaa-Pro peptidase family protein [Methylomirabilota bacterium]